METIDPMKALGDSGFLESGNLTTPQGLDQIKSAMVIFARNYALNFTNWIGYDETEKLDCEQFEKEKYKSLTPDTENYGT